MPHHLRPAALIVVGAGAFVGTLARYGLSLVVPHAPQGWPWPTFIANCVGAFCLCLILQLIAARGPDERRRQLARLGVGTGFLGAFTTYSSLATETLWLAQTGHLLLAGGYALGSVIAGTACGIAGMALAERMSR